MWEVRGSITEMIARIMFTPMEKDMVLLHGFLKNSEANVINSPWVKPMHANRSLLDRVLDEADSRLALYNLSRAAVALAVRLTSI